MAARAVATAILLCWAVVDPTAAHECNAADGAEDECTPSSGQILLQVRSLLNRDGNESAPAGDGSAARRSEVRAALLAGCGEVCDTSQTPASQTALIRKAVDCPALFANEAADAPSAVWPPPQVPPPEFVEEFTMGGTVPVTEMYIEQRTSGTKGGIEATPGEARWTASSIDEQVAMVKAGHPAGHYGDKETGAILDFVSQYGSEFAGKRLLVVGSMTPWLEAILLGMGAAHVTTVEYGILPKNPHPNVTTMTPAELRELFMAGKLQSFEGGASYSSIEHSGLGRYGDTVNPWGDLQAMAKVWCTLKPGSPFLIGVPSGSDEVAWNAHRRYGPHRWPHLMANFEYVDSTAPLGGWKQQAALYHKVG